MGRLNFCVFAMFTTSPTIRRRDCSTSLTRESTRRSNSKVLAVPDQAFVLSDRRVVAECLLDHSVKLEIFTAIAMSHMKRLAQAGRPRYVTPQTFRAIAPARTES